MDNELLRNGSGYVDYTAYKAMTNLQKGENDMEFKRGEIFEYEQVGRGEIRKALIVSADFRSKDRYLNAILLTEEPKGNINVPIVCEGMMYADCGMVSFVSNDRLENFIRRATDTEMQEVEKGIAKCLGIELKMHSEQFKENTELTLYVPRESKAEAFSEELTEAKAEAKIYKNLYEKLLAKVMG